MHRSLRLRSSNYSIMKRVQELLVTLFLAATMLRVDAQPGEGSRPPSPPFPPSPEHAFPPSPEQAFPPLPSFSLTSPNGLRFGFYSQTCPQAESLVRTAVANAIAANPRNGAALCRLFFHDAFVEGSDASICIDSTPDNTAEKDGIPNLTVFGYDIIDAAKASIEAVCNDTVSCADIVALAARDSINLLGGPSFPMYTGRRDGRVSMANRTLTQLPAPFSNLSVLTASFASKGLSQAEMVTLSGLHTIGKGECLFFRDRLYNFNSTFFTDPSLDSAYANVLKQLCPQNGTGGPVDMDPQTPTVVDKKYYDNLLLNKGLFTSDATLLTSSQTLTQVTNNAQNAFLWFSELVPAMLKMGDIGVKTGSQGEIRKNCRVINP